MDWTEVATVGIGYALVLTALFLAVVVGGLLVARDALIHDCPPAIRERHGPQSPRGRRVAGVMGLLNALALIGVPAAGVLDLHGRDPGTALGFWPPFAIGATGFLVLTVVDLLVLDWWLFCTVQPRFMVLPGTEGMPEYRDYAFHWRVLVPRPVPWPLLTIPGYGAVVGAVSVAAESIATW
ncbi:hypothetical protein [Streptomyces yaizuensis]|uniref:NADH dehydrogenase n=1 Tax=Streptomyces yaizuensis TaxID=2989713 RepID=A0ABQ5P316_9ACTN|nr:hypothetical protein [Streptomyces sp. YSPA8]GLF96989.1 NADH dehydrogenase [Streptomyces sp. YSPA8]